MSFLQALLSGRYQLNENVDVPELRDLYDCAQDPAVHAEGSVGVHTERVLEVTERLLREEPELDPTIARLAAVFHDIGKPATTRRTINGRIAAPNHNLAGFRLLGPLFDLDPVLSELDAAQKAAVRVLVREHLWSYNIEKVSRGAMVRLSHLVAPRHAYALWRADVEGRDATDRYELIDEVEYAWEVLKEKDAHQPNSRPYEAEAVEALGLEEITPAVSSELLRAVVTGQVKSVGHAVAYIAERTRDRGHGRLIYTVGLPGAGKSRLCAQLAVEYGWGHLAYDAVRKRDRAKLRAENWKKLEEGLREGQTMLVDATHLERRQRDPLIAVARRHSAETTALLFETSLPESIAAQKGRVASVPRAALVRMAENFRYPTPDEYSRLMVVPHREAPGSVSARLREICPVM